MKTIQRDIYLCAYIVIYQQNWDTSEHVKRHVRELREQGKEKDSNALQTKEKKITAEPEKLYE